MKFCRNFADNIILIFNIFENVEILLIFRNFEFKFLAKIPEFWKNVAFRGFLSIPRILTELRSEKFEWFGPSPIEPFNPENDPVRHLIEI